MYLVKRIIEKHKNKLYLFKVCGFNAVVDFSSSSVYSTELIS